MGQTTTNYVLATGEVTGYSPPAGGTHTDLGGVEFVNAQPRRYHIPAGYYDTALKRWVFQLRDYLGTPRVTFTDVNGDGQIVAADDVLETRTLYPTRRNGAGAPLRSRAFGTTASVPGYATDDEDFTGHALRGGEVDRVHGLHDMRARYYVAGLGLFGGVDPLASSFPGYSPYNYTMNDPISFTDPTGMAPEDIIIRLRDKEGNVQREINYNNDGTATNADGSEYEGGVEFFDKTLATLADVRDSDGRLDAMVGELEDSNWEHEITNDSPHPSMNDRGSQVLPQSGGKRDTYTQLTGDDAADGTVVTHELKHAYNIDKGLNRSVNGGVTSSGLRREEADASNAENIYRSARGLPLRTQYGNRQVPQVPIMLYDNFKKK